MNRILENIGRSLSAYLTRQGHSTSPPTDLERLHKALRPADVLLVEGSSRISTAIKYLTQSTWSHAALYVGNTRRLGQRDGQPLEFVEADVCEGVRAVSLQAFDGLHCRICRPIHLSPDDTARVIDFAVDRIGQQYDLKNLFDLARYLIPTPPVPTRWRRRMIALGSGDPTKAICSSLIAEAFESVRYPVLPDVTIVSAPRADCPDCVAEILAVRHHSLFVPRDFDVSPYFAVVKPSLIGELNYRSLTWAA
jgi:Permuted papain-like amidase enzyme, YaeF/YiiX, C92 family